MDCKFVSLKFSVNKVSNSSLYLAMSLKTITFLDVNANFMRQRYNNMGIFANQLLLSIKKSNKHSNCSHNINDSWLMVHFHSLHDASQTVVPPFAGCCVVPCQDSSLPATSWDTGRWKRPHKCRYG